MTLICLLFFYIGFFLNILSTASYFFLILYHSNIMISTFKLFFFTSHHRFRSIVKFGHVLNTFLLWFSFSNGSHTLHPNFNIIMKNSFNIGSWLRLSLLFFGLLFHIVLWYIKLNAFVLFHLDLLWVYWERLLLLLDCLLTWLLF